MNKTPMRPQYKITDKEMVDLIYEIFIAVDQPWHDVAAYDVYKLLKSRQPPCLHLENIFLIS